MRNTIKAITLFFIALFTSILCGCESNKYDIPKASAGYTNFFWKGKSNYVIIYPEKALPAEKTAVSEIRKYVKQITGFELESYKDTEHKTSDYEIVIGQTNRENNKFSIDRKPLGGEGFTIKWNKNSIHITGTEKFFGRGTLYGAFEFLRILGCEFYAKDTETIPSMSDITLKKENLMQVPPFEYRDLYWSCVFDEEISAKLRINGCLSVAKRDISEQYGGGITYAGDHFVHTFSMLVPPEEYFETHPEYFAEINGVRTCKHLYSQLCLTNPDVKHIVIEKVKDWLHKDSKSKIVSVSQNDSFIIESYCTCDKCKAINDEEGSPMGSLLRFVNAVADSIKDEFPDVAVDLLAYQYSVTPPNKTVPRDNVIVRYCTGSCAAHPIVECAANENNKRYISRWGKICDRIYIWDYTTNFAQYLCPFPDFYTLKKNIEFFRDNGVKGIFEQGMYQEGESGEFGELRAYVLAKLLWNPNENLDSLIDNFMTAYYGAGAQYVRDYFNFIHKVIADDGKDFNLVVNCSDLFNGLISDDKIKYLDSAWMNAKIACKDEEKTLSHIRRSELSYRFYKMTAKRGEFSKGDTKEAEQQFYKDCNDLGVKRLSEGANIPWIE